MHSRLRAESIFGLLLSSAFIFAPIDGFPNGAPWDTCLTMFPKHAGTEGQSTMPPFQTTLNATSYSPYDVINLFIETREPGHTLRGIQIRARPKFGDTEIVVGQFIYWPENKTQAFDCLGGTKNLITHRNNEPVPSIQLIWVAPNVSVGDIQFVISYVEDYAHFWVEQTVELTAVNVVSVPTVEQLSPVFEIMDWSECGQTKGCFLYPRTCSGYDCYAAVTYRTLNDSLEFEMFGPEQGYVSVGFSEDIIMGDDETITCGIEDVNLSIQRGYNHKELYNERQLKRGLFDIQGAYKDGRLYCRFRRPMSMLMFVHEGHTAMKNFDLSEDHYLMLAWGKIYRGTEVMGIHLELPPVTDRKVSFQHYEIVRGSSLPVSKQIHGALMMAAWILLVCIATVIARHFKEGFHGKTICGAKLWFQIHRALVIVAWLLTTASFVLIFVLVGKLSENAKIHSYLGITVMAASTLQIIMGLIRPKPDSSLRTLFNWAHWFLGKSSQIVAGVTLFFAFNIDMITKPQRRFANIVLGVTVGVQVLWELWFDVNKWFRKKSYHESYELKDQSKTSSRKSDGDYLTTTSDQRSPHMALVCYVICMFVTSSAAMASIFIF